MNTSTTLEFPARSHQVEPITDVVAIIGMGYVGLPFPSSSPVPASGFSASTLTNRRSTRLNRGESYIKHIGSERIAAMVETGDVPGDVRISPRSPEWMR